MPKEFHPKNNSRARQAFKNTLLGHATGLPIVIVRDPNGEQYVILTEKSSTNKLFFENIDYLLKKFSSIGPSFGDLRAYFENIMSLFLSRREKAVFLCALSLIFSPNSLRNKFGLNEDAIYEIKEVILDAFQKLKKKKDNYQLKVVRELRN